MNSKPQPVRQELQVLFGALCDGLRQEVRSRQLARVVSGEDVSLTYEREAGVANVLAFQLRSVGFLVQVESYIVAGDPRRRPDFRIWLPASRDYLYLELKLVAWGNFRLLFNDAGVWDDLEKLSADKNLPNGLVAIGFSRPIEKRGKPIEERFRELSKEICKKYPSYKQVGGGKVDLQDMDPETSYAVVGLWVRDKLGE